MAASALSLFIRVQQEGILVLQAGGWPAPFGITLVADLLASMLLVATGIVGVAVTGSSFAGVDPLREASGYHGLLQVLLMGVSGAFLTGDLFNLYVWFEVMLVASFVLMALHRTRAQIEGAFKYVTLNLIASSLFLTALGLLYGGTGTLNMADLAVAFRQREMGTFELVLAMLFFTAFGVKAALFPLFFWLPASYHTPPAAVGAVFAGLLTKVGVYALIRVFTLFFQTAPPQLYNLLLVQAGLTMIVGLIGALAQRDFRRVLSFNLVGHLGYTTVGLGLMTQTAMAAFNPVHLSPHICHYESLPDQRYLSPASPNYRILRVGFDLPRLSDRCSCFDDPVILAGGRAPVVRFRRQACPHPCDIGGRRLVDEWSHPRCGRADDHLDDPAVG